MYFILPDNLNSEQKSSGREEGSPVIGVIGTRRAGLLAEREEGAERERKHRALALKR